MANITTHLALAMSAGLLFVGAAAAQVGGNSATCATNVGITPTLRAQGYTERVGDMILTCTGGNRLPAGAQVPQVNIQIFLNAAVTSRLFTNGASEALLLIDEPGSGVPGTSNTQLACTNPDVGCPVLSTGTGTGTNDGTQGRPNVFAGKVSGNSVTFFGIPVDPPGPSGSRVFRITNIRANATSLSGSGGSPAVPLIASFSISGATSLLISNPTPTVAFVSSGLTPSLRTPDSSAPGSDFAVASCAAPQRAGVLRFSESFGTAFLTRTNAAFVNGETSPTPANQNVPGTIYNTESGFYNPQLFAPTVDFESVGLTGFGTRVRAQFNNIPAASRLWVSLRNTVFSGGTPAAASSGTVARLTKDESGPFAPVSSATILEGVPAAELAVTSGAATAVWEVLGINPNALENLDFVVWVQGGATVGTGTVNQSFAPAPPSFTPVAGGAASDILPIPRFVADPDPAVPVFTSTGCAALATTTTLSTSANNLPSSAPVSLTATVTAATGTPTGTVTFLDGNVPLATVPLVNHVATATVTLTAGPHTLTAAYTSAGGAFVSSTSAPAVVAVQSATRGGSGISLASSLSPSVVGQTVIFTATVTGGPPAPTGSVRFADGSTTLGTATLIGGQASLSVAFTTAGTHDIFAFYSGDSASSDSSTRFGQVVNRVTGTLTLSSNSPASQLTLTAQLSAPPAGAPAATGQIQFFDGANSLGAAAIVNGGASLNTAPLTPGGHQLSATYSGDANWFSARSQILTVTIVPSALSLGGATLPNGQVGVLYSGLVAATGGTPPYTYTGSGLPDGLSLSSSGAVGGTPTADGQFSFTVTVTDSAGAKATGTFGITILPGKLTVTTTVLPDGVIATAYSASLAASGGARPYSWTVTGLPGGVTASSDGAISGTPNATGRFDVTATVKDSAGTTASASLAVTITAGSPVITTASLPNGTVGVPYTAMLAATGGQAPLTFTATGLPAGLSLSTAGVISGTPTAPGTSAFTVTVRDSAGASPFGAQFVIVIALPPTPPLNFAGITATVPPLQQPRLTVALATPYPVDVIVTLTLTFAPDAGPDDPAVVFSNGTRTARITVPAGALNGSTDVGVQVGTVAGLITIAAQLQASGQDVTGSPAPRSTIRIAPAAPVITTASATRTATGFTITVTGLVTSREVTQAIFTLNPAPGANLQTTSLTIPVDALFSAYLLSTASAPTGTMFTYTQPFAVNGSPQAVASVTITLVNRVGSSATTTITLN